MQRFNMLRVPDEIGATPPSVLGSLYRFSAPLLLNTRIRDPNRLSGLIADVVARTLADFPPKS